MLLETESDMSSAEKALTEAVRRTEQEKQSAWNERLDLIEKSWQNSAHV